MYFTIELDLGRPYNRSRVELLHANLREFTSFADPVVNSAMALYLDDMVHVPEDLSTEYDKLKALYAWTSASVETIEAARSYGATLVSLPVEGIMGFQEAHALLEKVRGLVSEVLTALKEMDHG